MSIFYQHSHPILVYCLNVVPPPGLDVGYLRWEIGASLIHYDITKSLKTLLKEHKLTFRILQS